MRGDAGLQNLAERAAIRRSPLVVTAGGDGLSTFDPSGRTLKLPGIKIVVESTHGAGDAFVGTLAARIVSAIRSTSLCRSRIEKRQNWCRRLSKCRRLEERCMLRALRCGMWRLPRRSTPPRRQGRPRVVQETVDLGTEAVAEESGVAKGTLRPADPRLAEGVSSPSKSALARTRACIQAR